MTAQTLLAPTARQSSRTTAYVMTVGYSAQMHRWRPGVRLYWQLPGNHRGPHMRERGRAHYEGWLLRAQAGGRHFKTYSICSQDRSHLSGWKYYFLHLRSLLSTRSPPPLPLAFSPGDLTGFKRQKFHLKCRAAPSSATSLDSGRLCGGKIIVRLHVN